MKSRAKKEPRYYTHAHNIDACLQNGSFVRQHADGRLVQYMNGDCMGQIDEVPGTMTEVSAEKAVGLLPKCCK